MKDFLKTNAITLAGGSLAVGVICAGVSLSGNFDNQLHYCDSTTNPCTKIVVPVWLKQPPDGAKFIRVERGEGGIRFLASLGGVGAFGFSFIAFLVAADCQRLIDEQKARVQFEERMKQQVLVEEEVQKVAVAADARIADFKRRFFDAINRIWLLDNPEAARVFSGQSEPKKIEQVEEAESSEQMEAPEQLPAQETNEPETPQPSESIAKMVLKILRLNIEALADARLKHIKTYEGAAFNRYLFKGQSSTKWINALDDKAAELLQIELELERPPIISTVAGGIAIDVPRGDRKTFNYADYAKQLSDLELTLPIGVDLEGAVIEVNALDSVQGSNVLVGGMTRSGKSIWQTVAIVSLTERFDPGTIMLLVIDGKRTEFTWLDGSPHLLLDIAREPEDALQLLELANKEMINRQQTFAERGVRNLAEYNAKSSDLQDKPLICLFADELGNILNALDDASKEEARELLNQLSSQGIAAGIFLIMATQKPVVDDIPSKTKSNCATRICFRVEGGGDSRIILNQKGGNNLLGSGDLLATSPQISGTQRLQGLHIPKEELGGYLKERNPPSESITETETQSKTSPTPTPEIELTPEQKKELFDEAIERVAELCRKKKGDVLKARDLKKRIAPLRKLGIEENANAIREYIFPEICRRFPDIKPIGEGTELGISYEEISPVDTDT